MHLINGAISETVSVHDRGLHYGDGVFRTLRMRDGKPALWQQQYDKLAEDCARLRIECPVELSFEEDFAQIAQQYSDCVLKLIVTRGAGRRGYALPEPARPSRIVSASPLPAFPVEYEQRGVNVCWCKTPYAIQPALAGIKHLNRLENVLARSEWSDLDIAEGLMRDTEGNVISGTMSNLFLVKDGTLFTPDVSRSGIAGVTRARVIAFARQHGITVNIGIITPTQVSAADEVFLTNSVIGAWPVATLHQQTQRTWNAHPMGRALKQWLAEEQMR